MGRRWVAWRPTGCNHAVADVGTHPHMRLEVPGSGSNGGLGTCRPWESAVQWWAAACPPPAAGRAMLTSSCPGMDWQHEQNPLSPSPSSIAGLLSGHFPCPGTAFGLC